MQESIVIQTDKGDLVLPVSATVVAADDKSGSGGLPSVGGSSPRQAQGEHWLAEFVFINFHRHEQGGFNPCALGAAVDCRS